MDLPIHMYSSMLAAKPPQPCSSMADPAKIVRPSDKELDLFGITHRGKVRTENQDHFLVATVHPQVVVHSTSLPDPDALPLRGTRFATVLVLTDGVGGSASGSDAARLATESVICYVSASLRAYHAAGSDSEELLADALMATALEAHRAVRSQAEDNPALRGMATTLTLCVVVYPWAYVVQVGDSRAYHFNGGQLVQLTHDQTIGQSLVDQGLCRRSASRLHPTSMCFRARSAQMRRCRTHPLRYQRTRARSFSCAAMDSPSM